MMYISVYIEFNKTETHDFSSFLCSVFPKAKF